MKSVLYSLFAILLLGVAGCNTSQELPPEVANSLKKPDFKPPRDDLGREIKLTEPPQRIVVIGPGATETIFALGEGQRLVGRDQLSDYPAEAEKVPIVGDFQGPAAEKTVAVRPDLIIVQGETYDKARIETWQQQCGAPVAALTPRTVAEVAQGMGKIAEWLGVSGQANKISWPLLARAKRAKKPAATNTAFFEVSRSPSLWTPGRGTLIDDVMRVAGLTNVADISGYKQYNVETLVAKQPKYYIVSTDGVPDFVRAREELRKLPALRGLKCVQEGRVVVVRGDLVVRPGPRLLAGISTLEQVTKDLKK